jgi:hypothetical protein
MTGLHWSCKRGHIEIVKLLVKHGADIDFQDIIGRTALYFAIVSGNNEIVEVLVYVLKTIATARAPGEPMVDTPGQLQRSVQRVQPLSDAVPIAVS